MAACFSTAEYLSLFERKHVEAVHLLENSCFRPKSDKSQNGVEADGTKAYLPACYNLGRMSDCPLRSYSSPPIARKVPPKCAPVDPRGGL